MSRTMRPSVASNQMVPIRYGLTNLGVQLSRMGLRSGAGRGLIELLVSYLGDCTARRPTAAELRGASEVGFPRGNAAAAYAATKLSRRHGYLRRGWKRKHWNELWVTTSCRLLTISPEHDRKSGPPSDPGRTPAQRVTETQSPVPEAITTKPGPPTARTR